MNRPSFFAFWTFLVVVGFASLLGSCGADATSEQTADTEVAPLPDPAADYETNPYQWGFIDTKGKIAIASRYDEVRPFSAGLALVRKNGKWGYINKQGKFAIPATFRAAWPFENGRAKAQNDAGLFGFIDLRGEWTIPATFAEISTFSEGLACFREDQAYGFVDTSGQVVIPAQFERPAHFQDSLAIVFKEELYGMIDRQGAVVVPFEYTRLKPFAEGLARAQVAGKYGFINQQGQWVIPAQYPQASDFNAGLAAVTSEGQWGLIDETGSWQLPARYPQLAYASAARWLVTSKQGRYNVMDQSGTFLLEKDLDEIHPFTEDIAAFRDGELWGYLDTDGRIISPHRYFLAWPFSNGLARVATADGLSFIDREGFLLMAPNPYFLELREFSEGLAPVQVYR